MFEDGGIGHEEEGSWVPPLFFREGPAGVVHKFVGLKREKIE